MKVKGLIEILKTKNPDAEVYIDGDSCNYETNEVYEDEHGDIGL